MLRALPYEVSAPTEASGRRMVPLEEAEGAALRMARAAQRTNLGLECGAVSSDTLADHLEGGGFPAVLVLPFSLLEAPEGARHSWLLTRRGSVPPPLPGAAAMAAVYAALTERDGP